MQNDSGRGLFEVAQVYRAVYALRTAYDRQPVLGVAAAIAHGELLLRRDRLNIAADQSASAK